MKYKFRAECAHDASTFMKNTVGSTGNFNVKQNNIEIPDVDVDFDSELSLDEIRDYMRDIVDGHVMLQTIKPISEYDGLRDYDLE